jgi:membrane protein implicated in regulation of membrane protease activity
MTGVIALLISGVVLAFYGIGTQFMPGCDFAGAIIALICFLVITHSLAEIVERWAEKQRRKQNERKWRK